MNETILFDNEAGNGLRRGIDELADTVKLTLGPRVRRVAQVRGVSHEPKVKLALASPVAGSQEFELTDPYERIGAELIKEVAQNTGTVAGDGATTATVLAQALVREGLRALAAGVDPMALKRGIEKAVEAVSAGLLQQAKHVETKEQIASAASISATDLQIGQLIAEALDAVGKEGVITVEESRASGVALEISSGIRLNEGYVSEYFATDSERREAVLEDPYILIANFKITSIKDLLPLLEEVMQSGKPLLIIAEDFEGDALSTLVVNKIRGTFESVVVTAPGFDDRRKVMLGDIAVLTGGAVITEEVGLKLENAGLELLGRARKVIVSEDKTTIVDGAGESEQVAGRVNQIRGEIEKSDSYYDREMFQERLMKLASGVAVIKVGAATQIELKERMHRIEDAVRNAKAAIEEGIVAGGGVALIQVSSVLEKLELEGDEAMGAQAVKLALEAPLKQIAVNAGLEGGVVVEKVRNLTVGHGLDAATGEYVDMIAEGIIDPAKVTRSALQNAALITGLFLATNSLAFNSPRMRSTIQIGMDANAAEVDAAVGDRLRLLLVETPSTGYSWKIDKRCLDFLKVEEDRYIDDPYASGEAYYGGKEVREIIVTPFSPGSHDLVLRLVRPWEENDPTREFRVRLIADPSVQFEVTQDGAVILHTA
ncbi:chaperonin GroEL [Streptomyces sp. C10-9-1]|uniref:chaperonin GroEL n=1 Tax=Streptomyces sp. C10-9-1 TaxID=1859285 RepID=UPI003D755265